MQPSPYTPGEIANTVPGRSLQIGEFEERLSYLVDLHRFVGRIRVDVAPRGFGKTSLLRHYQRRAQERDVLTIWVTAGEDVGLIGQIAAAIRNETASWVSDKRSAVLSTLNALSVSVGIPGVAKVEATVAPAEKQPAPTGVREFEALIRTTVRQSNSRALIIFIDEVQSADPDGIRTLAYAWQHLQAEGSDVPAAVFAAGLPDAPDKISAVVTFAERLAFRPLERLSSDAEEIAISSPAAALGVTWDGAALEGALKIAGGYPYSVQLIADASWAAAGRPDPGGVIVSADVDAGRIAMRNDLDALFRARWANASPQEQQLMRAMADEGEGDGAADRASIAARMGVTAASLSVPRSRLIDRGFIQSAGRGRLEFTIPGFAEFIRRLED